jgi:sulfur carrier protein
VSTNGLIQVIVNGERRSVPEGRTIRQLLEDLQLDPARVAVELDRRIVKPKEWETTALPNEARLEIVQFVGGG